MYIVVPYGVCAGRDLAQAEILRKRMGKQERNRVVNQQRQGSC